MFFYVQYAFMKLFLCCASVMLLRKVRVASSHGKIKTFLRKVAMNYAYSFWSSQF